MRDITGLHKLQIFSLFSTHETVNFNIFIYTMNNLFQIIKHITICLILTFIFLIKPNYLKSEENTSSIQFKKLILIEQSPVSGPIGCPQNGTWLYGILNGTVPKGEEWSVRNSNENMVYYPSGYRITTTKNHWHCYHWGEMIVNDSTLVYWGRQYRYSVTYEYSEIPSLENVGLHNCNQ